MSDGGSAFPVPAGPGTDGVSGMTLRDYFAGQALGNATLMRDYQWEVKNENDAARVAYIIADAMLARRA